ncbi:CLUMA_CG003361, isoform A [Clunio marinus]|uniref:CLUMA_CG003361, isoform A n=1 Tax=Clunio marinus TaxID=568069 RepID=A0A1J1HTQ0_9DIPT|nr:CLUMA_CG003361, isoform A [Clunio marinus]
MNILSYGPFKLTNFCCLRIHFQFRFNELDLLSVCRPFVLEKYIKSEKGIQKMRTSLGPNN